MKHVRACRAAVLAGISCYHELLTDHDPNIRIAITGLLAALADDSPNSREQLLEQIRTESDPEVLANCVLALVSFKSDEAVLHYLNKQLAGSDQHVIQLALALTNISFAGADVEQRHIDFALQAIENPPVLVHAMSSGTWYCQGVSGLVVNRLYALSPERIHQHLDQLIELLLSKPHVDPYWLILLIFVITFNGQKYTSDFEQLTDEQRRVIIAVYDSNHVVSRGGKMINCNTIGILDEFGIPSNPDELIKLVNRCRNPNAVPPPEPTKTNVFTRLKNWLWP